MNNSNLKYIIYCRKSSSEDSRQAQSLDTQKTTLLKYAHDNKLDFICIYEESKSAKDENNRLMFEEMLSKIKNGEANALLVQHLDRLSRNRIDTGELIKLFQEGVLKEIRTPYKTNNTIYDLFSMDYEFLNAIHYSAKLSIRVNEGIDTKLRKGEFPGPPKLGYITVNKKHTPDTDRISYIKDVFDLYTVSRLPIKEIAEIMYEKGFRTLSGKKVYPSAIARMIQEVFYIGKFSYRGIVYQGVQKPMITEKQFNNAQEIRLGKIKPRSKRKSDFLYRGFLKCDYCGCSLTGTFKKNRYVYYYCTNGKNVCEQHKKYLSEDVLTPKIVNVFDQFIIDKDLANKSLAIYKEQTLRGYKDKIQTKNSLETHMNILNTKLDKLLDTYLDEKIDSDVYTRKQAIIKKEINGIESKIKKLQKSPKVILEHLETFKDKCLELGEVYKSGDNIVRKDLLNSALWNFSMLDGEIASIQYKLPYKYINEASKSGEISNWLADRDLNPER